MSSLQHRGAPPAVGREAETSFAVAVVLRHRGRIGMFKRSMSVDHDGGLWHCITGHLPPSTSPLAQAIQEVFEETGLTVAELDDIRTGPILALPGDDGIPWEVHTFAAHTSVRRLSLNWEHDAYRWVKPHRVRGFTQVHWLGAVMTAFAPEELVTVDSSVRARSGPVRSR